MKNRESFQHYYVFVFNLTSVFFLRKINLTKFNVRSKNISTKLISNLNKMYENNLQKVVIFIAISAI